LILCTQPPGLHYAEAMALAQLSGDLAGVTAYVTLEPCSFPCSFQCRTPSCAKALVASGIDRVIVAMLDPDPRNAGAGIEILHAGGIDVAVGLLECEAIADLQPYLQSHS
jgi:pyrimidine deaminase RibD-like protein